MQSLISQRFDSNNKVSYFYIFDPELLLGRKGKLYQLSVYQSVYFTSVTY